MTGQKTQKGANDIVMKRKIYQQLLDWKEKRHGVMGAYWNPRTHEMTVRYDARVTSARHIMHLVA